MGLGDKEQVLQNAIGLVRTPGAGFTSVQRGLGIPSGAAGIVRSGAGVYVFNLTQGIPSANCQTTAFLYGGGVISVAHTSDSAKTVTTSATIGGAAADVGDFDVSFCQVI